MLRSLCLSTEDDEDVKRYGGNLLRYFATRPANVSFKRLWTPLILGTNRLMLGRRELIGRKIQSFLWLQSSHRKTLNPNMSSA